jgi:hypothetical protein
MKRALVCLLAFVACRPHGDREQALYGPRHRPFSSEIALDDPRQAYQLVDGFYPIEGAARWTKPQFAALLATPPDAANLAMLVLAPAPLLQQSPPVTLSCRLGEEVLEPLVLDTSNWVTHVWPLGSQRADLAVLDCAVDRARTLDGFPLGVTLARISIER